MHPRSTEWELLGEAARIASSLRQKLEDTYSLPTPTPPDASQLDMMIPELVLPFPDQELEQLSALRIPADVREVILQTFTSRILQIQQEYKSSYRRTCLETSHAGVTFRDNFKAIHRAYQASSERHYLPMVKAHVSSILLKVAEYQKSTALEEKRTFNSEYTPFLERYFEYNAYPSAQHQSFLADKSRMTRRQIEVWFQNHRNRAKKDGRAVNRSTTDLPLRMALNVLEEAKVPIMTRTPSPFDEESATESLDDEDPLPLTPSSCIDAFDKFRPQHAFPARYPPSIDPFPSDNHTFNLPSVTWMRRPTSSLPNRINQTPIDMDELARLFHVKLNISEGARRRASSVKPSGPRSPWYAATVTTPFPAPLPAFVRPRSIPSPTILPASPRILSFQSLMDSRAADTANAFLDSRKAAAPTRKISPLPRRVPGLPATHMPSSSSQSISRTSSFGSEYSSRSRSSSSSSPNRTPEPTTPPQLPNLDIPTIQDVDALHRGFGDIDFSTLFGEDADTLSASFGTSGRRHDINSSTDKQPLISPYDVPPSLTISPSLIHVRS